MLDSILPQGHPDEPVTEFYSNLPHINATFLLFALSHMFNIRRSFYTRYAKGQLEENDRKCSIMKKGLRIYWQNPPIFNEISQAPTRGIIMRKYSINNR